MFPSQSLMVLLDFARGKTPWSVEVFDAALTVLGYFGRMWIGQQQPLVAGSEESTDDEVVTSIESLLATRQEQGHPVAGVPPILVSILIQWIVRQLAKNI